MQDRVLEKLDEIFRIRLLAVEELRPPHRVSKALLSNNGNTTSENGRSFDCSKRIQTYISRLTTSTVRIVLTTTTSVAFGTIFDKIEAMMSSHRSDACHVLNRSADHSKWMSDQNCNRPRAYRSPNCANVYPDETNSTRIAVA